MTCSWHGGVVCESFLSEGIGYLEENLEKLTTPSSQMSVMIEFLLSSHSVLVPTQFASCSWHPLPILCSFIGVRPRLGVLEIARIARCNRRLHQEVAAELAADAQHRKRRPSYLRSPAAEKGVFGEDEERVREGGEEEDDEGVPVVEAGGAAGPAGLSQEAGEPLFTIDATPDPLFTGDAVRSADRSGRKRKRRKQR